MFRRKSTLKYKTNYGELLSTYVEIKNLEALQKNKKTITKKERSSIFCDNKLLN